MVTETVFVWLTIPRYYRLRRQHPLRFFASGVQVTRERRRTRHWNLLELSSSQLDLDGILAGSTAFSIRMEHHIPWFLPSRTRAIAALGVAGRGVVGHFDARSRYIAPVEMLDTIAPFLSEVGAWVTEYRGWSVTITPSQIIILLPEGLPPSELLGVLQRMLQAWKEINPPPGPGYRGADPPAPTPEEIARIEAIANDACSSFPRESRGFQDG